MLLVQEVVTLMAGHTGGLLTKKRCWEKKWLEPTSSWKTMKVVVKERTLSGAAEGDDYGSIRALGISR